MEIRTLDVRGGICPDPLTLTMRELDKLSRGNHLKISLDSPMALETITRWAEKAGHRVLETKETGPGQWEIILEKG